MTNNAKYLQKIITIFCIFKLGNVANILCRSGVCLLAHKVPMALEKGAVGSMHATV